MLYIASGNRCAARYIDMIFAGGEWLVGGKIEVLERVRFCSLPRVCSDLPRAAARQGSDLGGA